MTAHKLRCVCGVSELSVFIQEQNITRVGSTARAKVLGAGLGRRLCILEPTPRLLLEPGHPQHVLIGGEVIRHGTDGTLLPGPFTDEAIDHCLHVLLSRREALLRQRGRGARRQPQSVNDRMCGTGGNGL